MTPRYRKALQEITFQKGKREKEEREEESEREKISNAIPLPGGKPTCACLWPKTVKHSSPYRQEGHKQ